MFESYVNKQEPQYSRHHTSENIQLLKKNLKDQLSDFRKIGAVKLRSNLESSKVLSTLILK